MTFQPCANILPNDEWWHRRSQASNARRTLSPVATHGLIGTGFIGELGVMVSCFDEQRCNLVVLESKVVSELNRASGKFPADSGGDHKLPVSVGDASDVRSWLCVCCSLVGSGFFPVKLLERIGAG